MHHPLEGIEQIGAVVGTGRGLGVVLNTKGGKLSVSNSSDGIVVEVPVSDFQAIRQGRLVDGKAVVLRSDFDASGSTLEDRLVGTSMTEFEFKRLGPARERQELVSKADTEDRFFAEHASDGLLGIVEGFGVPGPIAQEDSIGIQSEDFIGRCGSWKDRHAIALVGKMPCDVPLHTVIEADDMEA